MLVLAACGESATATPEPEPEEPETTMDDDAAMDDEDAMVSHVRPRSEWTAEEPATLEEIEAELTKYPRRQLHPDQLGRRLAGRDSPGPHDPICREVWHTDCRRQSC